MVGHTVGVVLFTRFCVVVFELVFVLLRVFLVQLSQVFGVHDVRVNLATFKSLLVLS